MARIEATKKGADVRYVVTSLKSRSPKYLYETAYCRRGQAREPDQAAQGPACLRPDQLSFAANCPDAALFRDLIAALIPRPT